MSASLLHWPGGQRNVLRLACHLNLLQSMRCLNQAHLVWAEGLRGKCYTRMGFSSWEWQPGHGQITEIGGVYKLTGCTCPALPARNELYVSLAQSTLANRSWSCCSLGAACGAEQASATRSCRIESPHWSTNRFSQACLYTGIHLARIYYTGIHRSVISYTGIELSWTHGS